MPRIVWTDDENLEVAKSWIKRAREMGTNPLYPSNLVGLAASAQTILQESRRKPYSTIKGRTGMLPMLRVVEKLLDGEENPPSGEPVIEPTEPKQPTAAPKLVVVETTKPAEPQNSVGFIPNLNDLSESLDNAARAIGKQLGSIVMQAMMVEIERELDVVLPRIRERAAKTSPRLPKVLVVGPLQGQQAILSKAVNGMLELKFVGSDEGAKLIGTRGRACDACVLWTNYISHAHNDNAKKHFENSKVLFANGGITAMVDQLEELAITLS